MMDSNKRLYCLFLNPTLRFVAMSSTSFSSQAIRGTTDSTPISSLVLAVDHSTPFFDLVLTVEEDEDGEEIEAQGK